MKYPDVMVHSVLHRAFLYGKRGDQFIANTHEYLRVYPFFPTHLNDLTPTKVALALYFPAESHARKSTGG